jgi:hypothetical protein
MIGRIDFSLILDYPQTMTIAQTVEVPVDHRLTLEIPPEIPVGRALLTFTPAPEPETAKPGDNAEERATPISDRLLGIASHIGDISLDELRTERLSKYLK